MLQIRNIEDNSKITFLIFQQKCMLWPHHQNHLNEMVLLRVTTYAYGKIRKIIPVIPSYLEHWDCSYKNIYTLLGEWVQP